MNEPGSAGPRPAAAVSLCPDCDHPWVMHHAAGSRAGVGCMVGEGATEAERCFCSRPLPMRAKETIDEAVARLGNVSGREFRRLVHGSRLPDYVFRAIREHIELLPDETDILLDVTEFWADLEPFGPNAATTTLLQEQDAVLEELREALAALENRLDVLRENKP